MRASLLLVAVIVGCSSSEASAPAAASDAGSDTTSVSDPTATCARFADAFCPRYAECADFALRISFGDVETCKKRVVIQCKASLTASGITLTPAQFDACSAKVPSSSCAELTSGREFCPAIAGTLPVSAPCGLDAQCATEFCAVTDTGCGTCAERIAEGAPCLGGLCGAGLRCAGMGVCVTPKPLGAACTLRGECAMPLSCVGGLCVEPAPLGAACSNDGAGTKPECNFLLGQVCTTQCIQADVAAAGAACGYESGTKLTLCAASGSCSGSPTGTCRAVAGDGEACDEAAGLRCMTPARCASGLCRLPDPSLCR